MRHFYIEVVGEKADWKAVDAAMIQAAAMAEKVAVYGRAKLAACFTSELKSPLTAPGSTSCWNRIEGGVDKAQAGSDVRAEVDGGQVLKARRAGASP